MKIQVLLLAASLFTLSASAQTKKIALRSHSGSDSHFDLSGEDDFGIYVKPDTSRHFLVKSTFPATPPSDSVAPNNNTKNRASSKTTKKKATKAKKTK